VRDLGEGAGWGRGVRRKVFSVFAALSLLLFAVTVVFWVRSYWVRDAVCRTDGRVWVVYGWSEGGGVVMGWSRGGPYIANIIALGWGIGPGGGWAYTTGARRYSYRDVGAPLDHSLDKRYGGFGVLGGAMSGAIERMVLIPYWVPSLLFSIFPVCWVIRTHRRRRQVRLGVCRTCSYNLTGNTSGVCPECGTPLSGKVAK
jgi:hypothetical protein